MRPIPFSEADFVNSELPKFDTSGLSIGPECNAICVNTVNMTPESHYNTLSRPVRDDQEQLFYDSETGALIRPLRDKVVDESKDKSCYVLQMIRLQRHRVCLFYDSGSNASLVSGVLAERLKLKVLDDRPIGIGCAGGGGAWSFYGSYTFGLGPDQEGYYYQVICQGMKYVTSKFNKYNLSVINEELKSRDPTGYGSEKLPKFIGGMRVGLLLGINCKLQPLLIYVLPSGLGTFRTQIKDEWGSRIAYGGPHPVFDQVNEVTHGNVDYSMQIFKEMVTAYLHSPYTQLRVIGEENLEESAPGLFMITDNLGPKVGDDIIPDVSMTYSSDYVHECCPHQTSSFSTSVGLRNVESYKSRIPLSKLKVVLDSDETNDDIRCEVCSRCSVCSKSAKGKVLSIQEQYEQSCIERSVRFSPEDKRCYVRLPFLKEPYTVLYKRHKSDSNYYQAEKWLANMCRKPPDMKDSLIRTHKSLVDSGFMQKLDDLSPVEREALDGAKFWHYMPWNIALKPDSPSTPFRITVDATVSGLNQILAKGTNRMSRIPDILAKIRTLPYVWASDIKKLYNRLLLEKDSLCYGLFLFCDSLDPDSQPITYVMKVAWYGVASTGGQAEVALLKVAEFYKDLYPLVPRILLRHKYVDDLLGGGFQIVECDEQVRQVKECLANGGFHLKFVAYSKQMPPEEASDSDNFKILGYRWHPVSDVIYPGYHELNFQKKKRGARPNNDLPVTEVADVTRLLNTVDLTRRLLVSQVAQLYDPCGLFEAYKLQLKLDLISVNRMPWDAILPPEMVEYWTTRLKEFVQIPFMHVSRCVVPEGAVDPTQVRLIGVADAATSAGGAAIYAGYAMHDGSYSCQLIASKSKLMTGTIPRNELDALALLATLMSSVKYALDDLVVDALYYTDSIISLCWISNIAKQVKTFVYTRVTYIRSMMLSPELISQQVPIPLFHIDGSKNPCDFLTKPLKVLPKDLNPTSVWISGYPWQQLDSENLPKVRFEDISIPKHLESEIDQECFGEPIVTASVWYSGNISPPLHQSHCSGCPQEVVFHPFDVCYGTTRYHEHCDNCSCSLPFSLSAVKVARKSNSLDISLLSVGFKAGLKTVVLMLKFICLLKHKRHISKDVPIEETCEICKTVKNTSERNLRRVLECKAMDYFFREESKVLAKELPKKKLDQFVKINDIYYLPSRLVTELSVKELDSLLENFFEPHQLPSLIPVVMAKSELAYAYILYVHHFVIPHSGVNATLGEIMKTMFLLDNPQRFIQAVRKDCSRCRIIRKKSVELRIANHPEVRTTICPPFYTVAVDTVFGFSAQWYPGSKRVSKAYALAIVCIFTGAVNILTMDGLCTRDVLSALERHSDRYGAPGIIYVDQGSQLIALSQSKFVLRNMAHNLSDNHAVEVRVFNAKNHEGNGRCESRVRLLRQMLEKMAIDSGKHSFTQIGWETIFSHISNSLNDTPIAKTSRSTQCDPLWDVITPNRLILGKNSNRSLTGNIEMESGPELSRLMEKNRKIMETWYSVFASNLRNLVPPPPKWSKSDEVKVGDVVLFVFKDNAVMKQDVWKLGRIIDCPNSTTVEIQYSIQSKTGKLQVKTLMRNPRQISIIVGEGEYGINTHEYLDQLRNSCKKVDLTI